ncbi:molybdopterin molybdotransferase MoeA [Consotaella aegiceratis]|uniref:molybdopterin molybdotransferase MoeA n=1 Tax=Consotaella aegiceratis TaxID=3097961 RepID=UPI002F419B49
MISVEEAVAQLVEGVEPASGTEDVALHDALERVLATELRATRTQPDFDSSAMDGYAVRAADLADLSRSLEVIGEAAAGSAFDGSVGSGQAVRIFTGAPVPAGADSILIQENAETLGDRLIRATAAPSTGQHIRPAGNDFAQDDILLSVGTWLRPGALALAASGGHPILTVRRRPRVAVLATGSELVAPGEPVGPAQIVASNGYGVAAIVRRAGGEILDYGIAPDDPAKIAACVDRAIDERIDLLVTIGGASVGDHDHIGAVFEAKGVSLDFWKVAMRPGKPIMAGRLNGMRLIGLPGNPASSLVAASVFLRPLVRALAGRQPEPLTRVGRTGVALPANPSERTNFLRSISELSAEGGAIVTPMDRQDSSLLSIYARASALLMRPAQAARAEAGDPCLYVDLD